MTAAAEQLRAAIQESTNRDVRPAPARAVKGLTIRLDVKVS